MKIGNLKRAVLWEARQAALQVVFPVGHAGGRLVSNSEPVLLNASDAAVVRMMRTLFFGVSPFDPLSFAAVPSKVVGALLLAAEYFTSACIARRARSLDVPKANCHSFTRRLSNCT